ncbi:MAG: hypothetical protein Q8N53_22480 [Longimicrobiales bacterium]|nr:hypothetical protein [Longimicrobiales bacterium]
MRRRLLLLAVILSVPSGCDNVRWGGVDMRLQAPPSQAEVAPASVVEPDVETPLPRLPDGPILLAGSRDGDRATLVVVGEVRGDALGALPTDEQVPGFQDRFTRTLLAPGTELVLFSEGVRVGRLTVTEAIPDPRFCAPRPRVTGLVELVPGASAARNLLALTDTAAKRRPWGQFRSLQHDYDQRVASIALATAAIPQVGAPWPPSLVESRADIQAFRLPEAAGPSVAATFLLADRLEVADAGPGAYAVFVLGTLEGGSYRSSYVGFRRADTEGKGAPRYFSHLDWDADGDSEVLLDVLGADTRWFASLGQRGGAWVQTFQDPCGEPTG